MLTIYEARSGALRPQKGAPRITEQAVWLDLLNPTPEEEATVERALKLDVPTREEQQEIEVSSRLYQEDGTHFMTATVPLHTETATPTITQITFILAQQKLVTVRYAEPRAFPIFVTRSERAGAPLTNGTAILVGLIEIVIDRLADFIQRIEADVENLSQSIFEMRGEREKRQQRLDVVLRSIGREGEISSLARESASSLARMLTFLSHAANEREEEKLIKARIRTAGRDVQSLIDHVTFLSSKTVFLLDATLGKISIQQNDIIKIFSIAAVVFLPPTLIASIYGMNFEFMPELKWLWGYPFALVLMVLSAVLPYLYFKRRGWM